MEGKVKEWRWVREESERKEGGEEEER